VIFFVRYGVSQTGHMTIESEHLLLGLVHEDGNILSRFVHDDTLAAVRDEITSRMAIKEKVLTSVDLPLSNESRRILAYAAEEAKTSPAQHGRSLGGVRRRVFSTVTVPWSGLCNDLMNGRQ
jgi:ATP-dependent Clp protease ATP-binding subunit ClpC